MTEQVLVDVADLEALIYLRRWWAWLRQEHLDEGCWCVPRRLRRTIYTKVETQR